MLEVTLGNWRALAERVYATNGITDAYERLHTAYENPPRPYHNLDHVKDCLREFAHLRSLAEQPDAIELALWFHDAVYDSRAADNEARSVALARELLEPMHVAGTLLSTVERLILITRHDQPPTSIDEQIIVDVDLAILGQPPDAYQRYEQAIREEYAWVPEDNYRAARKGILQAFLTRSRLYHTDTFHERYTAAAQRNVRWAIERL